MMVDIMGKSLRIRGEKNMMTYMQEAGFIFIVTAGSSYLGAWLYHWFVPYISRLIQNSIRK